MFDPRLVQSVVRNLRSTFAVGTLMVALCILAVVSTTETISQRRLSDQIDRNIAYLAEVNSLFLSEQIGGMIKFGKVTQIEDTFGAMVAKSRGAALGGVAVGADGTLLFRSPVPPGGTGDRLAEAADLARQAAASGTVIAGVDGFTVAAPVRFGKDGAAVGALATVWTAEPQRQELEASVANTILVAGLVFVTALVGAALFQWVWLSRPLRATERAMERVADGDLEAPIPASGRRDEIGGIARSLLGLRDRLRAAREAEEENAFRSAAVQSTGAALILLGPDLSIRYANPAWLRLVTSFAARAGQAWARFAPDEILGAEAMSIPGLEEVGALLTAREGPHEIARRWGRHRLRVLAQGVRASDGTVIGYVMEFADVSDETLNAAVLGAIEEHQLRLDIGEDRRVADSNEAVRVLTGRTAEDLHSLTAEEVLTPVGDSDGERERTMQSIDRGKIVSGRFELPGPAERRPVAEGTLTPILGPDGAVERVVFIGADVTESYHAMRAAEEERRRNAEEQATVVNALKVGLGRLAGGDLTTSIPDPFGADYEQLRVNFNQAVRALHEAMDAVVHNAESIRNEAGEITNAADDLARRTERQAATLEETAAALDQLTASVRSAAEGADEASSMASTALGQAETGGGVARRAVGAMDGIKASSKEISKITSVIDDIAFQTSLLALNAGVEAARAGEAGRGFAVVATEVRALAQRSSEAAREINDLISASGQQVQSGVELVNETGEALSRIVDAVSDISNRVAGIAASAREQSGGLNEINLAINDLDQVTQQNAAMFEETNAASHALTTEATALVSAAERFNLSREARSPRRRAADRPARSPAEAMPQAVNAPAPREAARFDRGWEEF